MEAHLNVDLAMVFLALSHCDRTGKCLSLFHVVCSVNVENCVFPVSIRSIWRSAESNWVLEVFELAIEPGDDGTCSGALLELELERS